MAIEKLPQQGLDVDGILSSGKDFQITQENVDVFFEGMSNAKKRKSCKVCILDNVDTINVVGGDGKLKKREVVIGGKRCEATERDTRIVTVFKYIGSGIEEVLTSQEVDGPMWTCPEFIKRVRPPLLKKTAE